MCVYACVCVCVCFFFVGGGAGLSCSQHVFPVLFVFALASLFPFPSLPPSLFPFICSHHGVFFLAHRLGNPTATLSMYFAFCLIPCWSSLLSHSFPLAVLFVNFPCLLCLHGLDKCVIRVYCISNISFSSSYPLVSVSHVDNYSLLSVPLSLFSFQYLIFNYFNSLFVFLSRSLCHSLIFMFLKHSLPVCFFCSLSLSLSLPLCFLCFFLHRLPLPTLPLSEAWAVPRRCKMHVLT